jgi:ketosteroid isomerase-like protein
LSIRNKPSAASIYLILLTSSPYATVLPEKIMISRAWLAAFFLVASALAQSPRSSAAEEVRRAERSRIEALVSSDLPRLERLLGDDLTYTHSTGTKESKTEFLRRIQSGELKYDSMQHQNDVSVRVYGDTSVLTGTYRVKVRAQGQTLNLHVRFTEVWVEQDRGSWRLVAWQATRIAEE